MSKKKIHYIWRRLRVVKPYYFLIIAVVFGVLSIFALRQNNITMIHLRDKVYQADKDNGDVEGTVRNLREYIYGHMNTNLSTGANGIYPPLQLKYSYDRALDAAKATGTDSNADVYTQAQQYCEKAVPQGLSGRGRIPCIQDYVAAHGSPQAATVSASLYEFDFISPRWSADFAGITLMAAIVFAAIFVIRVILDWWLKTELDE